MRTPPTPSNTAAYLPELDDHYEPTTGCPKQSGHLRLHIGHRRAGRLHEACLRAENQGAEQEVGERKDDVEILVHVAVMQEMVAVEFSKPPWFLHAARLREVHAPVDILVEAIIRRESQRTTYNEAPLSDCPGNQRKWDCTDQNKDRAIPPCHRDRLYILLVDNVVGLVCFKNLMVNDCVCLKRVTEIPHRAVHHVFVESPFKERGKNYADCETREAAD